MLMNIQWLNELLNQLYVISYIHCNWIAAERNLNMKEKIKTLHIKTRIRIYTSHRKWRQCVVRLWFACGPGGWLL